ncbi:MAG: hypothetical protein IJE09_00920 [Oscillospiraceae bacterium]|nr:hypothetical protein [Oscillospiraceae bacterium]
METAFFLASNSGGGFYSMYDEFPGEGVYLHIIKGGPGTGKSGFMRSIAEEAGKRGLDMELIYCSGDPDSLDGLYVPALKQAWMDGTAPHVREPGIFGGDSDYVNLGRFCRLPLDAKAAAAAADVNRRYKTLYASAHSYLAAEAAVANSFETEPLDGEELEQVENIISDILQGGLRRQKKGQGRCRRRFISAISCQGKIRLDDTVNKLCKQYYCFENHLHAHQLLSLAAKQAREIGLDTILCPEPLRPQRLEAVMLPEPGICFRAAEPGCDSPCLSIHFGKEPKSSVNKVQESSIKDQLRRQATLLLASAKALHDELELIYRPYMDFDELTKFRDEYIENLFK